MKHCEKCKVAVRGMRQICPLCQGNLNGTGEDDIYPNIPTLYHQFTLFFRILILSSVASVVFSVAVNLMIPQTGYWSLLVALGVCCLWISLAFAVRKRNNLPKTILYQVIVVSSLSLLWDFITTWHGWSIDYVIPCVCILGMCLLAITSKVLKIPPSEYILFLCLDGVFGIIPLVFFLMGKLNVLYPSITCIAISILSLVTLLLFEGKSMSLEMKKRFHM